MEEGGPAEEKEEMKRQPVEAPQHRLLCSSSLLNHPDPANLPLDPENLPSDLANLPLDLALVDPDQASLWESGPSLHLEMVLEARKDNHLGSFPRPRPLPRRSALNATGKLPP